MDTKGIPVLFTLIEGLPLRLTECVHLSLKLFKNAQGVLLDGKLHDCQSSTFVDGERALVRMPVVLLTFFPDVTWTVDESLGRGVPPLMPVTRSWRIHKGRKLLCERKGFIVIPDFAGRAHMVQGQTADF